jgi:hypothetical protein
MNAKLTLKLNKDAMASAKNYAIRKNTSLSSVVEDYFVQPNPQDNDEELTPIVKKLLGIIKVDDDFDINTERHKYLDVKYAL